MENIKTMPVEPANALASAYSENGYVVLPDMLSREELEAINHEAVRIFRGEQGAVQGILPATSTDSDDEVLSRYLCIHFPHKISNLASAMLKHPRIVQTLKELIGPNIKCMQSMLFIKASGKPGQAWHQDENFIPTRDHSLTAAWIALDDATVENGCLWVLPGSHKSGIIWPQRQHHDPRFDASNEAYMFPYKDEDAVAVEVKAGSIVFFNGYLLHRSLPNLTVSTTSYRRALVNHYMSAESLLPWSPDGEFIEARDFRDIVMVAGEDPYNYKGLEERTKPKLRAT